MKKLTTVLIAGVMTLGVATGAVAFGKKHFADPETRGNYAVKYISKELSLDQTQTQALEALKDQVMSARSEMKGKFTDTRAEVQTLISADEFDQAGALELVNSRTTEIQAAAPEIINALGNFLDSLNAEQKAEISEKMQKMQEHRKHRMGKRGH